MPDLSRLRIRIFGIDPDETSFVRRGFRSTHPDAQERLERVGRTFVQGYHLALEQPEAKRLTPRLEAIEDAVRGFAYEGAAMALALLDGLTPWGPGRFADLLHGAGDRHAYMMHVGAGWAAARLPWGPRTIERSLGRTDPLLGWLAIDGFGFHQGYFQPRRFLGRRDEPAHLSPPARRVFDQGLGRSLWFVDGADVTRVRTSILGFAAARHADLWSGIGLACAYAGGLERAGLEALRDDVGAHQPALAQGAAFAAKARERAGNPTPHTELACSVLCGMPADEAAAITDACLPVGITGSGARASACPSDSPYEQWRLAIQRRFAGSQASADGAPPAATREVARASNG